MSQSVVVPIVIDTNTLIPSIFSNTHILYFLLAGNLIIVWNMQTYNEARRIMNVLWKEYYGIKGSANSLNKAVILLDTITFQLGRKVDNMPSAWPKASLDRNDDPFLYVAVAGEAEFIVSSDKRHMVSLGAFQGIPMGDAAALFEWLKVAHPMS